MSAEVKSNVVQTAQLWAGVAPPNKAAEIMAADLGDVIAAFEKLRGTMRFEDEPSTFEAALAEMKETP